MSRKQIKMKPGKGQSAAGFAAGLLFCIVGLFVAIPNFGFFGIIWTLFAVGITVANAMNAFTDEGLPTHEITIEDESNNSSAGDSRTAEQRLEEARRLYESGLITKEEYDDKRKQILEEL